MKNVITNFGLLLALCLPFGILFQNISIAAPSVLGEPQILWGQADARIRDLTFDNLTLAGKPVRSQDYFKTNEFVEELVLFPSSVSKP